MRTTIKYPGHRHDPAKIAKGHQDVVDYLSRKQYALLSDYLRKTWRMCDYRSQREEFIAFRFYCSMAGIDGYPVHAFARVILKRSNLI